MQIELQAPSREGLHAGVAQLEVDRFRLIVPIPQRPDAHDLHPQPRGEVSFQFAGLLVCEVRRMRGPIVVSPILAIRVAASAQEELLAAEALAALEIGGADAEAARQAPDRLGARENVEGEQVGAPPGDGEGQRFFAGSGELHLRDGCSVPVPHGQDGTVAASLRPNDRGRPEGLAEVGDPAVRFLRGDAHLSMGLVRVGDILPEQRHADIGQCGHAWLKRDLVGVGDEAGRQPDDDCSQQQGAHYARP